MAVYPGAVWRPLPENAWSPRITPTQLIFHSAVTKAESLWPYFGRRDVVVESHLYVQDDGDCEQYMDSERKADANYKANPRAISVETWDNRDPNNLPWSDTQMARLVDIAVWGYCVHGIPLVRAPRWDAPGMGGHTDYLEWSNVRGKTCPGLARRGQVDVIIQRARDIVLGPVPSPAPLPGPVPVPVPLPPGDEMDAVVSRWGYLKRGSTGQGVMLWQGLLNGMGRKCSIDGDFGPTTERLTREWQVAANAPGGADGVVGANSWGRALGTR